MKLSDWIVCLRNIYTWGYRLKPKAMSIVNFSDRQKTSKWQKKSVLVKNVFYVIHLYHIYAFLSIQSRYTI